MFRSNRSFGDVFINLIIEPSPPNKLEFMCLSSVDNIPIKSDIKFELWIILVNPGSIYNNCKLFIKTNITNIPRCVMYRNYFTNYNVITVPL